MTAEDAKGHANHNRTGIDTAYVETCWICAADWQKYVREHPEEAVAGPVVLAQRGFLE